MAIVTEVNESHQSAYTEADSTATDKIKAAVVEESVEEEEDHNFDTRSHRCLKEVLVSHSSLLLNPLYHFPEVKDPGIDAAYNYVEPEPIYDDIGVERYKTMCKELGIVAIGRVMKCLAGDDLNLMYYGITFNQMRALCDTLRINAHVQNLNLQDNWLSVKQCTLLGDMLADNASIKVLNLRECRIGPEGVEQLVESFQTSTVLEELDLSFNSLGNAGLKLLGPALRANTSIKKLNLSHNCLDEDCIDTLAAILKENPGIQDLDLSWNLLNKGPAMKKLGDGLKINLNLRRLNFAWNGLSTKVAVRPFSTIIRKSEILEFIDLSNNGLIGPPLKMVRVALANTLSVAHAKIGSNLFTPTEAFALGQIVANKPRSHPLQILDMENMTVEKKFLPFVKKAKQMGKTIIHGNVLGNYEIKGPDINKLLFNRAIFLAQKPKKKKLKRDFGHFVLKLPEEPMTKQEFDDTIKKQKVKLDVDLVNDITNKFLNKKKKIDTESMKAAFMAYWPETVLPEEKPKKKKKKGGKKGKKDKKGDAAKKASSTAAADKKGTDKKEKKGKGKGAKEAVVEGDIVKKDVKKVEAGPPIIGGMGPDLSDYDYTEDEGEAEEGEVSEFTFEISEMGYTEPVTDETLEGEMESIFEEDEEEEQDFPFFEETAT